MIKLFQATDRDFSSNGDKIIQAIKAKVKKQDNDEFYLELETGLEYVNDIVGGNILVAPTPQGEQAFRITNPQKTRKRITTKAKHVFYDSQNYLIKDSYVVDMNCNNALEHLNNATDNESPFTTFSDIQTVDSYRCVRTSLGEAISTVLERWGGHLVRDNFNISILSSIGQDNGVVVRYGKNLKDISVDENWDNVVTKLLPTGKDGIMLNALDNSVDPYVYSTVQYDTPFTKHVAFNQDINEEDFKSARTGNVNVKAYQRALIDDLRQQAQTYVEANCYPSVNYTLNANLERITDVGDVVEVIDERLDLDLLTNIISYEYDCILGKYTQLEFGNFKKELSNLVQNITQSVTQSLTISTNNSNAAIQAELLDVTNQFDSVLSNGYVIYDGDTIKVIDTLPKESAQNVVLINNQGISFSQDGINGTFTTVWSIDGTFNMANTSVLNLTASLIKGGVLKLGSNFDYNGVLELYDSSNTLIGKMDSNGLKMQGNGYLIINETGLTIYDSQNNRVFWAENDEIHIKKSVIEQEITLCNKIKCLPIADGVGFVGV